jgi:hypothetical protein
VGGIVAYMAHSVFNSVSNTEKGGWGPGWGGAGGSGNGLGLAGYCGRTGAAAGKCWNCPAESHEAVSGYPRPGSTFVKLGL